MARGDLSLPDNMDVMNKQDLYALADSLKIPLRPNLSKPKARKAIRDFSEQVGLFYRISHPESRKT